MCNPLVGHLLNWIDRRFNRCNVRAYDCFSQRIDLGSNGKIKSLVGPFYRERLRGLGMLGAGRRAFNVKASHSLPCENGIPFLLFQFYEKSSKRQTISSIVNHTSHSRRTESNVVAHNPIVERYAPHSPNVWLRKLR